MVTTAAAPLDASRRSAGHDTTRVRRVALPDARLDRLFFAQVREDPALEIAALEPRASDHVAVVTSGGCTALSLLGAGAGRVTAVDLNVAQNHITELKAVAVGELGAEVATAFLGGAASSDRLDSYRALRELLSPGARAYWDTRPADVRAGVIRRGVSERFIAVVVGAMRLLVHPQARVQRLLACRNIHEQRVLYEREWNSRRWRLLFTLLLNRRVFNRTYDPAFFELVQNPSFARHFHALVERGLTELPVATNYFLHQMMTGEYPVSPLARPPYLTPQGAASVRAMRAGLSLVDGSMTAWLRTQPAASIDAFALSNIGEWLDGDALDALFAQVVRTASQGARLVYRNFVGWTDVPPRWRNAVKVDVATSDALSPTDRSLLQRRIVVCRVAGGAA